MFPNWFLLKMWFRCDMWEKYFIGNFSVANVVAWIYSTETGRCLQWMNKRGALLSIQAKRITGGGSRTSSTEDGACCFVHTYGEGCIACRSLGGLVNRRGGGQMGALTSAMLHSVGAGSDVSYFTLHHLLRSSYTSSHPNYTMRSNIYWVSISLDNCLVFVIMTSLGEVIGLLCHSRAPFTVIHMKTIHSMLLCYVKALVEVGVLSYSRKESFGSLKLDRWPHGRIQN